MRNQSYLLLLSVSVLTLLSGCSRYVDPTERQKAATEREKQQNTAYAHAAGLKNLASGVRVPLDQIMANRVYDDTTIKIGDMATFQSSKDWGFLASPHANEYIRQRTSISNAAISGVIFEASPATRTDATQPDIYSRTATILASDDGFVSEERISTIDDFQAMRRMEAVYRLLSRSRINQFSSEWYVKPTYDRAKHRIIWGLKTVETRTGDIVGIHYWAGVTLLGRRGIISIQQVTPISHPNQDMKAFLSTVTGFADHMAFLPGSRYEDHSSGDSDWTKDALDLVSPPDQSAPSRFSQLGGPVGRILGALLLVLTLVTGRLVPARRSHFKQRKIVREVRE